MEEHCFFKVSFDLLENQNPYYLVKKLVFPTSECGFGRDGGEGFRLQSQEVQDLCTVTVPGHLMFKTSTEDQTVDLTNKVMTRDSERFSSWFHITHIKNTRIHRQHRCFWFLTVCVEHSESHTGLPRDRNTNLNFGSLASETM